MFKYKRLVGDKGVQLISDELRIPANSTLLTVTGPISSEPDKYTVQVGDGKHMRMGEPAELICHSCDPNCKAVIMNEKKTIFISFVSIKDIKKGEEFTWDYNTTESALSCPFECLCGAKNCVGNVVGSQLCVRRDAERSESIARNEA